MPVTIGTLTSSVQVSDGGGTLTEEMTERIVRMAVARMREELRAEIDAKADSDVSNRKSDAEPY